MAEKDKDLRGAKSELREITEENVRLGEKLTDIRAQKTKFSRLAREKAEEMGKRGRGGGEVREGEGVDRWVEWREGEGREERGESESKREREKRERGVID